MRILTVSHFFAQHGGGIERVAEHLCREFGAAGHVPSWAASSADAPPDAQIAQPVPMPCHDPLEKLTGLPMPIPTFAGLRRLAAAVRVADAVIIHDALYITSITAMIIAKRARKPVLIIQHIAAIPFRAQLMRQVMRLANRLVTAPMLRNADHVVFISDSVRQAFATLTTKRAPQLLFNGVDARLFNADRAEDGDVRARFDLPKNRKLLLFVGRFVEKKGMAVLAELAKARPDLTIAMAGQGPIDPASWNCPNVKLLGQQTAGELAALYRSADALVLPSVGEGYPLVIQEAMACGLPVICHDESAAADPAASKFLNAVEIKLSEPAASAARVAAAIDQLKAAPERRIEMAQWAQQRYSWRSMARAITAAFSAG